MKAWELLGSPDKWTQKAWARGANGEVACIANPPVCWCLYGAIRHCYSDIEFQGPFARLQNRFQNSIAWNDAPERTWEEVYAVLKEMNI